MRENSPTGGSICRSQPAPQKRRMPCSHSASKGIRLVSTKLCKSANCASASHILTSQPRIRQHPPALGQSHAFTQAQPQPCEPCHHLRQGLHYHQQPCHRQSCSSHPCIHDPGSSLQSHMYRHGTDELPSCHPMQKG